MNEANRVLKIPFADMFPVQLCHRFVYLSSVRKNPPTEVTKRQLLVSRIKLKKNKLVI
jgi:hypothetical protein